MPILNAEYLIRRAADIEYVTLPAMPRKRGGLHGADVSRVLAVRVPNDLADAALDRCGGQEHLSEWLRNMIRQACGRPLNFEAGYEEGKMKGWADANAKFRAAMKGSA